jgi:hypothetical protein
MSPSERQKSLGSFYTPDTVVRELVSWVAHSEDHRLLDPSCGDGRFIAAHQRSVGVETDPQAAERARQKAPWALVHEGDFFSWAERTEERFECVAGNPPFIRYQLFKGEVREKAIKLCARLGVAVSGLSSSWAPFVIAASSLLLPGGSMAFVVPAEIGHAPYAAPLIDYLVENFGVVHVIAVRDKLFPDLSEDCWLLYAAERGGHTRSIRFTALDHFVQAGHPPRRYSAVTVNEWRQVWNRRLRPHLLPRAARDLYRDLKLEKESRRLGDVAGIGIGYVSGANEFFHLTPTQVVELGIPKQFLHASVRNSRALPEKRLTRQHVDSWIRGDSPIYLLRLPTRSPLPREVERYLDTDGGREARTAFKCRSRDPWYSVPDVQVPDFFLSYMSGVTPSLVENAAECTCTNSIHSIRLRDQRDRDWLADAWQDDLTKLSCEIEGHPLGGGMLKVEVREAANVVLAGPRFRKRADRLLLGDALQVMRSWRHYGAA